MSGREADKARERAGATGAGVAPRVGEVRRLVVKIGSSTLTTSESTIDYAYLNRMADQIARVREAGWRPVIVTSAAIACGLEALGIVERPHDMPSLQAAASVGQGALSAAYAQAFARHGLLTSVVLLTRRDTADRTAYLHARDTLLRLLELGVVPVVNENDTVSVEQIRFGDNDTLAALVACLIDADLMVILSDIDGLYDANPHRVEGARLIGRVERIDQAVMDVAGEAGTTVGSGGMITKIKAARVLMAAGIPMVICNGRAPDAVVRAAEGEEMGTRFVAAARPHEITPKKLLDRPRRRGARLRDGGRGGEGRARAARQLASVRGRGRGGRALRRGRHRGHQGRGRPPVRARQGGVRKRRGGACLRPHARGHGAQPPARAPGHAPARPSRRADRVRMRSRCAPPAAPHGPCRRRQGAEGPAQAGDR